MLLPDLGSVGSWILDVGYLWHWTHCGRARWWVSLRILLGSTAVPLMMWRGHLNRLKSGFRGLISCPGWDEGVENSHRNTFHTDKVRGDLLRSLSSLLACGAKSSSNIRGHLCLLHRGAKWRYKRHAPSRVLGVTGYVWSHLQSTFKSSGNWFHTFKWKPSMLHGAPALVAVQLSRTICRSCYDSPRR